MALLTSGEIRHTVDKQCLGCKRIHLYGPHWFNADLSVSKSIQIRESVRMTLQASF